MEKMLSNQRKEIEEKSAQISGLEMRMEELENKFKEEKKTKQKKIKDLENLIKNKSVDDKTRKTKKESLKCQFCDFETTSERGLSVHMKRKHTNLKEFIYPVECDFCDLKLNTESELKMHIKITHTFRETKFNCEDCDYCGENELSVEVHQGKCQTVMSVMIASSE